MKTFKTQLVDCLGREWIERIEAQTERDVKDVIYRRYGVRVTVLRAE